VCTLVRVALEIRVHLHKLMELLVCSCVHSMCRRRNPSLFCLLTAGVEVIYFHLITLRHTPQSEGLLWTRDRPDAETSTLQHKHCTRNKHPCPPVGFEPTIPTSARPQTYALDRAATGIGRSIYIYNEQKLLKDINASLFESPYLKHCCRLMERWNVTGP
jgi:hypothetical protein